jgi:hypothetical protein
MRTMVRGTHPTNCTGTLLRACESAHTDQFIMDVKHETCLDY